MRDSTSGLASASGRLGAVETTVSSSRRRLFWSGVPGAVVTELVLPPVPLPSVVAEDIAAALWARPMLESIQRDIDELHQLAQ
eukprot:11405180-Alexandrium_andersonii.AAC.1